MSCFSTVALLTLLLTSSSAVRRMLDTEDALTRMEEQPVEKTSGNLGHYRNCVFSRLNVLSSEYVYIYIYIHIYAPPPSPWNPRLGAVNQCCNIIKANGVPYHCSWEGNLISHTFAMSSPHVSAKSVTHTECRIDT